MTDLHAELAPIIAHWDSISPEWADGVQRCVDGITNLLVDDVDATIRFLDHDVTGDELSWISGSFDDLIAQTQSRGLCEALERAIRRFPEEDHTYYLMRNLELARSQFEDDD